MSGAPARLAAADILIRCLDEGRTLDDAITASPSFDKLSGADRAFARAMASMTLRHLGRIDIGLAPFLARPLEHATPPARALARLGAAQSWLMDTPDHAVVSETVSAAKMWPRAQQTAGFLNAVLRKVVEDSAAFEAAPETAIWPSWFWDMVASDIGEDAALRLLSAQQSRPDLDLTVKEAARRTDWLETLGGLALGKSTIRLAPTRVEELPGYTEGAWWVQDAAAAIPAQLLAAEPGQVHIDLCAAPGGKTMQLAGTGADVIAVDRSKPRLRRLRENLKRTKLEERAQIIVADGATWTPDSLADGVLLDAPCSALGTLRRHPEGPWIKSEADIRRFSDIQARLLRAALGLLKPGGTLVYCVCSPLSHEGIDIVQTAISEGLCQREPIPANAVQGFERSVTQVGDLLTIPGGLFLHDAFYISRLRV